MSQRVALPAPVFGVLRPNDRAHRQFSAPLPAGHMPMTQSSSGSTIAIVEQSQHHVVVENRGTRTAFYAVYFISETGMRRMLAVKDLIQAWRAK